MDRASGRDGFKRALCALVVVTAVAGVLPYVPYGIGRMTGTLPSEAQWLANHGPWNGHWATALIDGPCIALILLPLLTVGLGALAVARRRRLRWAFGAVGLASAQWWLAWLISGTVLWAVD